MRGRSPLFLLLLFGFSLMTALTGFLYSENLSYKKENQGLIIQNDSVLSANIELKKELKQQQALTENKLAVRQKGSYKK